ncbi:ABC transporter ATP-binding protein [Parapedobacter pyrenivorans]|uniref:ABC transporter ATP-binding protein n=1 Tax=Parapedobacter pyrenivorans TaxID=1305674 RepID=A0A917MCJ5_9SPHI|nr:ABC-F family ATP-binding cassette domain-containing protein [Parapedobacter pyrenivorans]GGG92977.1 ABC transporter ATP-binding protein [Parapedobacter pyrenivorans]
MLTLQGVTYTHPNSDLLFDGINLTINKQEKVALIGNNGVGKSTLLKLLAGHLLPSSGQVRAASKPYYLPQLFGQFNDQPIAQALQVADKLHALQEILAGHATEVNMEALDDDWMIEERCAAAFAHWGLDGIALSDQLGTLSGGQKARVFLAGIDIHQPDIVLLDEPSNHLDSLGRELLYTYVTSCRHTLVVVSHDRALLNRLNKVCELGPQGITVYGGNYDFYTTQKAIATGALNQQLKNTEKSLRKAKETARESMERQHKLDARGKKKQEKAGLPTIVMKTLKDNAEKSTSRMKGIHAEKTGAISEELGRLRDALPDIDKMKLAISHSTLHQGKRLLVADNINFGYGDQPPLWKKPLSFQVLSGDRTAINGANGSGKTTLINVLLGNLHPRIGSLHRADAKVIYIDQDYSLIANELTVVEQAHQFNSEARPDHELKICLHRFLFTKDDWEKPCAVLSGGEKMRLLICCMTIDNRAPDIIVLDEPTNNLDIQNIEILTAAINEYRGTLLVISHDTYFLKQIKVTHTIEIA